MIGEIIVDINILEPLDYEIPRQFQEDILGRRVIVEVGRKDVVGLVSRIKNETEFEKLKKVKNVIDEKPVISKELLETQKFVSEYYLSPLGKVVELSFPNYSKVRKEYSFSFSDDEFQVLLLSDDERNFLNELKAKKLDYKQIQRNKAHLKLFENLSRNGIVTMSETFLNDDKSKSDYIIRLVKEPREKYLRKGTKKEKLFNYIREVKEIKLEDLRRKDFYLSSYMGDFLKEGLIQREEYQQFRKPEIRNYIREKDIVLSKEQVDTIAEIKEGGLAPYILYGVTGSGKTEIYIELIKDAIKEGKSVLILVPEISLISQLYLRIQSKIPEEILLWHSNMSNGERLDTWGRLQENKQTILLGARSAVFAPINNLGLIIVDEEHETSYKQTEPDPRYHGVEVAIKRAEINGAKIVLGSATPSVERYYKGLNGSYNIKRLKNRPNNSTLPKVHVVDLKREFKTGNISVFSNILRNKIIDRINKKEQIIIFLNRRGFSKFVMCRECGEVIQCSNCSVPMTFHRFPDRLKCHYCENIQQMPKTCPKCASKFIKDFGIGTQKIQDLLEKEFPGIRVLRLDQDTTRNKESHQKILSSFSNKEADVLLGTQMVAKGLDFENVSLVGVISADLSLNIPDIYSAERTFELLTQVAGRSGRGDKLGEVVIQTYNPEHYSIEYSRKQDYISFYKEEIREREILEYPPFSKIIRIVVSSSYEKNARNLVERIAEDIEYSNFDGVDIMGPGEAPIFKIKDRYRYQVILKTKTDEINEFLLENYKKYKNEASATKSRYIIDIDPQLIL